ncbi:MAG: hypothetical protein KDE53_07660 [Caldilineaceae bacterium]|nr:hypothetical protein [Caldilineaceae bacterium]
MATNPTWRRLAVDEVERITGNNCIPINPISGDLSLKTLDVVDFDD